MKKSKKQDIIYEKLKTYNIFRIEFIIDKKLHQTLKIEI